MKTPSELLRGKNISPTTGRYNGRGKRKPVDLLPKTQCHGSSRAKLKLYWLKRMLDDGHADIAKIDEKEIRYSEVTELARGLGYDTLTANLPQDVKDKVRCAQPAVAGCMVCRFHGGSLKHVIEAGRRRLLALLDPSLDRLTKIITKGKHEPAGVAAIKEVLDRVGLKKMDDGQQPGEQAWSEEMINQLGKALSTEELDVFIRLVRKVQAAMPDDNAEESTPKRITGTNNKIPVIEVGPAKMAELITANVRAGKK